MTGSEDFGCTCGHLENSHHTSIEAGIKIELLPTHTVKGKSVTDY